MTSADPPVSGSPPLIVNLDVAPAFETEVAPDLLEEVLTRAVRQVGLTGPAEVSVVVTDDAEIHRLNRQYRGVDAPTDVLSFSQTEPGPGEEAGGFPHPPGVQVLGDVVISGDRVRAQAAEYGHSQQRELAYLAVHGLLHLLGYDHETEPDRQRMRQAEEAALATVPR